MTNKKQSIWLLALMLSVCFVFTCGLQMNAAYADYDNTPLNDQQKDFIHWMLFFQIEGGFERWGLGEKTQYISAMKDYGFDIGEDAWKRISSPETSESEKLMVANEFLTKHYGRSSDFSNILVLSVDWPNQGNNQEDARWYQAQLLAATEYYDLIAQPTQGPMEMNAEQAVEKAKSVFTEIYNYSDEEVLDFAFNAEKTSYRDAGQVVWQILCWPKNNPQEVYSVYYSTDGKFIDGIRPK